MFNEGYHQEYERAVHEAKELTKELHDQLEKMEHPEEGFKLYRQDPQAHLYEKHREVLERLRHASEHYFGTH